MKSPIITPAEWESKFTSIPNDMFGYTKIVCTHAYYPTKEFYVSSTDWQDNIRPLLTPYWCNHYTIVMLPCDQ